jgi:hypothetical protein
MDSELKEIQEKAITKIQQLLNLAKSTHSLEEQSTAFAMAQQIAERYKLSMAEVEANGGRGSPKEEIKISGKPLYEGIRSILWKSNLAWHLCTLNDCKFYYTYENRFGKSHTLFMMAGRESDMEIIRYMFNSIVSQIEIFCKEAMSLNKGSGKTYSNNFKLAAVSAVANRLTIAKQEVRKEYAGTAALVLVNQRSEEVTTWVSQNMKLKKVSSNYNTGFDPDGMADGAAAGNKVSLNKGLNK